MVDTDKIEFEFQLTEQEFVAGVRKITYGIRKLKYALVIPIFLLVAQLWAYIEEGNLSSTSPIVIVFLVIGFVFPLIITRSAKKQYKANSRVRENVKFHVDRELIQIEGETYTCDLRVDKIVKTKETKELLLIYEMEQQAHLVPKRALSDEQLTKLKEIVT